MKILHAMILDQRDAKHFAARVVKAMIRLGCSAEIMRKHNIPRSVFYWSLGARAHRTREVCWAARDMIDTYRRDFLGLPNHPL